VWIRIHFQTSRRKRWEESFGEKALQYGPGHARRSVSFFLFIAGVAGPVDLVVAGEDDGFVVFGSCMVS
jgi:hypothetical protein